MVRLCIVEDQEALLRALVKALSAYSELQIIGTASNGERAVDDIVRLSPDLVLLDLELPGLDGIQVTRAVKSKRREIEILILTSFDDEVKVYDAIRAGASGYLVKRVGPEKIRSAIHEVMAGGTVVEPAIARRFWNYFQSVQAAPAPASDNPWGLDATEVEILIYLGKGLSNAEVGRAMELTRRRVRTHLGHIYRKMGVSSHVDAVVLALQRGIISI